MSNIAQENDKSVARLTENGQTHPWRAVLAPLAASVVLSGCAVLKPEPEALPPLPPRTAADFARAQFYAKLNAELAADPKLTGSVLVVDPTPYPNIRSFVKDVHRKLDRLVGPWEPGTTRPPLYRITGLMDQTMRTSEQMEQLNQFAPAYYPLLDVSGLIAKAAYTTLSPRNPDYVCLAVGIPSTTNLPDLLARNFSFRATQNAAFTPAFLQAMQAADPDNTGLAGHEAGHCVHGGEARRNESHIAATRRLESGADAFEMLRRIRDGEADMLTKLETKVQWRRAVVVSSRENDVTHDSSGTMRLIIDDLRRDPQLGETFKGLTATQLEAKAAAYADRAQLSDYPHLADKSLSKAQIAARNAEVDAQLLGTADYVSGRFLIPGHDKNLVVLPASAALRVLQLAHTAEQYLVQPPQSQLASGINQLRAQFPETMREADRTFAAELKQYPPLASAAINQQPAAPVAQRQLSPRVTPRHAQRGHTNHRAALIHKPAR